jgi:hypothetical protein
MGMLQSRFAYQKTAKTKIVSVAMFAKEFTQLLASTCSTKSLSMLCISSRGSTKNKL